MNNLNKIIEAEMLVIKHLSIEADLSTFILKGHLLIEELLFALVEKPVQKTVQSEISNFECPGFMLGSWAGHSL